MEQKKVNSLQKQTDDIVKSLESAFKGLPHLPENIREVLVKIAPILSLVFGVLGILFGIASLGISPLVLLGGVKSSMMVFLSGALAILSSILMLMAYPKLNKRLYSGWVYLFWSEAVSAIAALLTISLGSILGILIGLYILFEVKSHYK